MTTEKTRRPHGTGSIYPLPGGGYRVQVEAGWTAKGTRRYVRRNIRTPGRTGLKEAKATLAKLQRDSAPAEGSQYLTVKAWADRWQEIQVHRVRPKAFATDKSQIRCWIVPTIGHRRLDKLTPGDVRSVARAILDAGRADSTAQRAQSRPFSAMRAAVSFNPFLTRPPSASLSALASSALLVQ